MDVRMKKLLLALAFVALLFGAYSFGQYQSDEGEELSDVLVQETAEDKAIDAEIEADEAAATKVTVTENGFEPSTVTVKKGQKVVWLNNSKEDVVPVYSSFVLEEVFGTEEGDTLEDADGWELGFTKAGTYEYYDGLNPERKGKVVVEE